MRARQVPNLGPDRANLGVRSSVRANTILEDAVAHLFLQEGFVRSADIAGRKARRLTLGRAAQRRNGLLLEVTGGFEPNHLVRVAHGLAEPVPQERPELVVELLVALRRLERPLLLTDFSNQLVLQLDDLADVLVRHLDGLNHLLFRDLDGLALYHHDGVVGTGHHHVEHALIALEERRVDEELIVLHAHADRANGTFPRNRRDRQGGRRADNREDIGVVFLVGRQDRGHDLDLGLVALREERADRPVRQAGGEDRGLGRATFALRESARDLAGGEHALFVVNRQGEERQVFARFTLANHRAQHHRVAIADDDRPHGQAGEATRLQRQCSPRKLGRHGLDILLYSIRNHVILSPCIRPRRFRGPSSNPPPCHPMEI